MQGSQRPNIVFVLTDDLSSNLVPYMPHVEAMERRLLFDVQPVQVNFIVVRLRDK